MTLDPDQLRFGIEAEYLVLDGSGRSVETDQSEHHVLQRIVDRLPDVGDPDLTRGDLAIKWSRWYVEGDERFDQDGNFLRCVPKGIETRTPICVGIEQAMAALTRQTGQLQAAAAVDGYRLAAIGYHPLREGYRPDPAFNEWELEMRAHHSAYAASEVFMRTYGPDVNLSHPDWTAADCVLIGARLAMLAPALVAFSLNAPFAEGDRWDGYSKRISARAGCRPSVRVFLADPPAVSTSSWTGLEVCRARLPAEHGRIEFKAYDAFPDLSLFASLLALTAGVALADSTLEASGSWSAWPVEGQLRRVAQVGLDDPGWRSWCGRVLTVARTAWRGHPSVEFLERLDRSVDDGRVPAHELLEAYSPRHLPELSLPATRLLVT